jgi:hypothetical protein
VAQRLALTLGLERANRDAGSDCLVLEGQWDPGPVGGTDSKVVVESFTWESYFQLLLFYSFRLRSACVQQQVPVLLSLTHF